MGLRGWPLVVAATGNLLFQDIDKLQEGSSNDCLSIGYVFHAKVISSQHYISRGLNSGIE
jgi:hypothetical protein